MLWVLCLLHRPGLDHFWLCSLLCVPNTLVSLSCFTFLSEGFKPLCASPPHPNGCHLCHPGLEHPGWLLLWTLPPCPLLLPPSPSHSLQAPPTCRRCGSGSRPRCSLPALWPHFLRSPRLSPLGHQAPAAGPPSEASTHQGLVLGVTSPPHGAASACRVSLHPCAHRTLTNILSFVVLWLSCAHSRSRGPHTAAVGSNNGSDSPQNPILSPHLGPPVGRKMSSSSEADMYLRQHSFAVVWMSGDWTVVMILYEVVADCGI